MVTTNVLVTAFPASESFDFAVILGWENSSSFAPSMFSPVIVTSKLVPACPPIGNIVSKRGAGRQTSWASDAAPSQNPIMLAAKRMTVVLRMILMIVEVLFGVDDRPEQVFVGFALGDCGIERFALRVKP